MALVEPHDEQTPTRLPQREALFLHRVTNASFVSSGGSSSNETQLKKKTGGHLFNRNMDSITEKLTALQRKIDGFGDQNGQRE